MHFFLCICSFRQGIFSTGGIAIPGACIGIFLGGYLLKRFSLRPKGAIQMVMAFNLIGLSFYGLLFVLGCDNVKMAGTTSPYFNKYDIYFFFLCLLNDWFSLEILIDYVIFIYFVFIYVWQYNIFSVYAVYHSLLNTYSLHAQCSIELLSQFFCIFYKSLLSFHSTMAHSVANTPNRLDNAGSFQVNLTAWCNTGCSCSSSLVEPVCGNNGLTYFSACHAGCTSYSQQDKFANCTCKLIKVIVCFNLSNKRQKKLFDKDHEISLEI